MLHVKKITTILCVAISGLLFIRASFAQTYYGSQLMSPEERAEHRAKMRSLPPSERDAYRARHHQTIKERAESMGLSLPEQHPAYRGYGPRGPGYGYGRGGRGYWGPGYNAWRNRGGYSPGYGGWGYPTR